MFGAVKPGFATCMVTLKLVMNVVGELETEKNSSGIARFPCDSTVFLFLVAGSDSFLQLFSVLQLDQVFRR